MKIECQYTELVPVDNLVGHPDNPNKHSDAQIKRLAKLIKHHGFRHPVIVSKRSGFIIAGHGRWAAAKELGCLNVPVDYQEFASDDDEYMFMISDNAIQSDWAELDLGMINLKVPEIGPVDIELLGFKDFTIDFSEKGLIERINRGDETSEWVDMPEFTPGSKYICIILHFESEQARAKYAEDNSLVTYLKKNGHWLVRVK